MKSFNIKLSFILLGVNLLFVVALWPVDGPENHYKTARLMRLMKKASYSSLYSSMHEATTWVIFFLQHLREALTTFFTIVFRSSPFTLNLLLNFTHLLNTFVNLDYTSGFYIQAHSPAGPCTPQRSAHHSVSYIMGCLYCRLLSDKYICSCACERSYSWNLYMRRILLPVFYSHWICWNLSWPV